MDINTLTQIAYKASVDAGQAIMNIYLSNDFGVEKKSDESPLTKADLAAHQTIIKYLESTNIPILSEEAANISFQDRKQWNRFWLVDPLDGTKEFIKKNDEFTVNIALIENHRPIIGIVYLPVFKSVYIGAQGLGSFHSEYCPENVSEIMTKVNQLPKALPSIYTVVGSRSHMNEATQEYFQTLEKMYGKIDIISTGSSLKLCMVAEGKAHEYPRFGPTMEWDTAAGDAVAYFSGAKVTKDDGITPLNYNKENLLNPFFIVKR
ncbi:MAG: 3'(2'),5'-bisphosphate nucleotidase CysQ [Bacteroidales bacterium]|nr:3'(2'),5'-bisphosphate nucleotidase CysQ [Bacteroidales bacterium]